MEKLAEALRDLTWSEMVRVSEHIADSVTHHWENDEPVDRDIVAQILSDLGADILKEAELERASQATGEPTDQDDYPKRPSSPPDIMMAG